MKAALALTAVLSVLAIGAILGPTPGAADEPAVAAAALVSGENERDRGRERDRETGPPPWARGHGHAKPAKPAKPVKADRQDGPREAPPGSSKHPGKIRGHGHGHGHGMAMRAWAHCVGDAARGLADGERIDREQACGGRPVPPGQLKKG